MFSPRNTSFLNMPIWHIGRKCRILGIKCHILWWSIVFLFGNVFCDLAGIFRWKWHIFLEEHVVFLVEHVVFLGENIIPRGENFVFREESQYFSHKMSYYWEKMSDLRLKNGISVTNVIFGEKTGIAGRRCHIFGWKFHIEECKEVFLGDSMNYSLENWYLLDKISYFREEM